MAIRAQTLEKLQHFALCAATVTAIGDQTGVDISDIEGDIQFILNAAAAGSGATFDARIEHADTLGGAYTAVTGGSFTQIGNTAAKQVITLNADELKGFVRFSITSDAGTGSSYMVVNAIGLKKYG
jgi:hypothetical protein